MKKEDKKHQQSDKEQDINNKATADIPQGENINLTEEQNEADNHAKMSEELAIWQDKYIRLSAEFDNYRKRTLKEKMDLIENAGADVIKSMLTIVDDMERAVVANQKLDDIEVIRTGTEIIHKKLNDMLRHRGVIEIEAMGSDLDTDLHEAIAKFPVPEEDKKGKIIDVVEKGYKLKDKVLRYAKVVIGE